MGTGRIKDGAKNCTESLFSFLLTAKEKVLRRLSEQSVKER